MNQKNNILNENRYLDNYEKKIKRIKIGVILVIIIVSYIIATNALSEIHYNWVELALQKNYILYQEGAISSDTYYSLKRNLEFEQDFFSWISLIVTSSAEVVMNIGFLIIILGFLSITIDRSFNKKMRRISLILASIIFIFMIFLIFEFVLPNTELIIYYPPFYRPIIWE